MAKVKWSGIKELEKVLRKKIEDEIRNKTLLDQIGAFVVDRIQSFTRSGKTLATSDRPKQLKKLKPSTIKSRYYEFAKGEVDPEYFHSPDTSQLTLTGQLLRAMTYKSSVNNSSVEIYVDDTSRKEDTSLSNADVAKYVAEAGRPFLGLDKTGIKRVQRMILTELRKKLRFNR
jgi:hypothetical protein